MSSFNKQMEKTAETLIRKAHNLEHKQEKSYVYRAALLTVYGWQMAIPVLIGIGGVVTFKNAIKMKEAVKIVPEDMFLLETDAPYLAPTPHRGELNHSKYLPLIAQEIAALRGESIERVSQVTDNNFKRVFKI